MCDRVIVALVISATLGL